MNRIKKLIYVLGGLVITITLIIYLDLFEWKLIGKTIANQDIGQQSIVVRDSYAYYIAGNTMIILDISDPNNVDRVSTYSNGARLTDIALYENFAILSSLDTGLLIINIRNPEEPELIGVYPETGEARFSDILINDSLVFVDDRTNRSTYNQIIVFDITDPTQIKELSHITNGGKPLAIHGNFLYTKGDHIEDPSIVEWLNIIDISDIGNPKLMLHSNSFGTVLDAKIQDRYLYITTPDDIVITDISDPTAPAELGRINIVARQLQIQGDFIYYMGFEKVGVLDISDVGKPKVIAVSHEVEYATDMVYSMNYVYFVGGSNGLLYIFEGDAR